MTVQSTTFSESAWQHIKNIAAKQNINILQTTITGTFLVNSVLSSLPDSFGNFNRILAFSISVFPFMKLVSNSYCSDRELIIEKMETFKKELKSDVKIPDDFNPEETNLNVLNLQKEIREQALTTLNKITTFLSKEGKEDFFPESDGFIYAAKKISSFSLPFISAVALFSENNSFISNLVLMSLLFRSAVSSSKIKCIVNSIVFGGHSFRFLIYPIFQTARQHFSQNVTEPLQNTSLLPTYNTEFFIESKNQEGLIASKTDYSDKNLHESNFNTGENLISSETYTQIQQTSNSNILSFNSFTQQAFQKFNSSKAYFNPFTECSLTGFDSSTDFCPNEYFSLPQAELLPTKSSRIDLTEVSKTSSYFSFPLLAGIAATAIIGYAAFKLYRKFTQKIAPQHSTLQKASPEPQKVAIKSSTLSNEQFRRFQKINAEYNLSDLQEASSAIYDHKRYIITNYVISTAKFAKALIFNVARCIGYVVLSTFSVFAVVTKSGRSYLKINTARAFINLTGSFISFLGLVSPFLGNAAYVTQMKILLSGEKLNTAQIHQYIQS